MTLPAAGRVLIIGTGIAGATAAETLRKRGFGGRIVLVGADPAPPYRRPMVSKELLSEGFPPEKALLRTPAAWRDLGVELRTGLRAERIDPDAARVAFDDGTALGYDALLLATGGTARLPAPLAGAHTLRYRHDAAALRPILTDAAAAGGPPRLVIVGGGLVGTEAAASARAAGAEVTVLEAGPRILDRVLPEQVAAAIERMHRARGVAVHTGVTVASAAADGATTRVRAADGREWIADAVVVAVGMVPDDALARAAGLAVDDGIVVDDRCATSVPGIYAAGDVARFPVPGRSGLERVEHWNHALAHGAAAAGSILGDPAPYTEVPWCWTTQFGRTVQIAGWPALGTELVVDGDPDGDRMLALALADDRLVGAVAVGRPRDLRAARTLLALDWPVPRDLRAGPVDLVAAAAGL